MAINEDTSFIEYPVDQPTQDFVTNFDTIGWTTDVVLVTVDGVLTDTLESSYTAQQINYTTWRVTPEVQTGSVVRLYRVTNIDEMMHVFTAGAKFIARNMDSNFKQIRHAQQEVRDGFSKLKDDIGFTNLEQTVIQVQAVYQDTLEAKSTATSAAASSVATLAAVEVQANLAQDYADAADAAKAIAQQAASDVSTAEEDVYTALTTQQFAVNTALSQLSTTATKFYPTLTEANADITNLEVSQPVTVGDSGLYYKATAEAATLTKSDYDPLTQAKNYADANPRFKSVVLTGTENFDTLPEGRYFIPSAVVATALDTQLPPSATSPKIGWIEKIQHSNAIVELVYSRYSSPIVEYEVFRRRSNGGSGSLTWLEWQKDVSRYEFDSFKTSATTDISDLKERKAEINLFPDYALTSNLAATYQATLADEDGYPTLTMDTGGVTLVSYDVSSVSNIIDVGKTISFSAEIFCTATGTRGGDVSIQALSSSSAVLQTSANAHNTKTNEFEEVTASLTLPVGTAKIRLRIINRNGTGNTVCKFRNATLISDYAFLKYINPTQQNVSNSSGIFFVSKSGGDSNNGTASAPFLTLQKALNSLPPHGGVIEVGGGVYREVATVSSKGNVWIRSKRNERAVIFGSDQLVVSKSTGYTQVYQAPLAAKPVGMGGGRGKPVIFEWGTPSKPILDSDRHHLHRSRTHRLPYTEMFEAANKAELDTVDGRGKWFWEGGVIYFAATDGSNATLKQYEARVRPTIIQTDGVLHLTRVDTFFSSAEGGKFNGILIEREDCRTFGNYHNGFSDNANIVKSLYDEAGGNGNDGMNGTVTSYNVPDVNTRLIAHYIEPHCHDNSDDGLSYHYRGNVRIDGGLCEFNTKADVVHVTGATCVCAGTVAQGTLNGFYVATTATGDSERTASYFKCINTTARNNTYSYRAADDGVMECENTKAINPTGFGYYQTGTGALYVDDCKYSGAAGKMKSGNVVVENFETVT